MMMISTEFPKVFSKSLLCSPRLHLFDQNYSKKSEILPFEITLFNFKIKFIPVIKAEFPASLLQFSVSHDPSEIILVCRFVARKHFLLSVLITFALLNIFGNFFMKEQHLFKIQIFCYIIHLFTTTFDQFNASLLIEHLYLFQGEKLILT